MSKFKQIITPEKTALSYEEIVDYVNNKLTPEQCFIVEEKMMANNLNRDALEGFAKHPEAFAAYEKASDSFHANIPVKKGGLKFQHGVIGIVLFGIVFYSVGAYFLMERDHTIQEQKKANLMNYVADTLPEENAVLLPEVIIEELNDLEIDSSSQLSTDEQIDAKQVIEYSPIVVDTFASDTAIDLQIEKVISLKKQHPLETHPFDSLITKKLVYTNIPTRYSHGLLIVDYSQISENNIVDKKTDLSPILGGTPSTLENQNDRLNEGQIDDSYTEEIEYLDYVAESQLLFVQNKFKKALKRYKVILEQYPDDLNAHFYAGLCYFNINQPYKAIEHFDSAIKHKYNTFNEESEWYKAKSLAIAGDTQSLISLLNKIASKNGFYSAKASKWLEKL